MINFSKYNTEHLEENCKSNKDISLHTYCQNMNSETSTLSGRSSARFGISKIDSVEKGDTDLSDKPWDCLGSDHKSLDRSDTIGSDPYSGFSLETETSIATGGERNPNDYNKLPDGWVERIAPKTKECYFYDKSTRKVYFTLPPNGCREAEGVGWNGVAGKYRECNYRCILRCKHILVKHRESDKCSSYRKRVVKRTKEQALHKILQARDLISAGQIEFAELAKVISDCCSARNGGDLGPFKLTQTCFGFEKKVLRLNINELSDIFETKAGYHILLRTAVNDKNEEYRKKHRHLEKLKYTIGKDKFKTYLKGSQKFSSFMDESEADIYNMLGQRQGVRDSESNFRYLSCILYEGPSLSCVSKFTEKSGKLKLYTQQKQIIKKKIIQDRLDMTEYLEKFLKLIETDSLGNCVVKDHKLKKDLFFMNGF
ncbi:uncharacterized protein LOC108031038 [Drosophila biarmipes]|uniref:uncharacterized protein LOC108031038 n=1 Tax=Drosophila biarmipes TaxID=125945 RepID=UPI0021CCC0A8|nr:uncharacterized protein LOC108031038 [Drosophila biarmipes]